MTTLSPDAQERETFAWEWCPSCGGSGNALNTYTGEPDECPECKGNAVVRARDARGRYVGKEARQ